jgi:site-specific recombinase
MKIYCTSINHSDHGFVSFEIVAEKLKSENIAVIKFQQNCRTVHFEVCKDTLSGLKKKCCSSGSNLLLYLLVERRVEPIFPVTK